MSLYHINIRRARQFVDNFENYLNMLNHDFTVIGLPETWLNDNDSDLYGLCGYKAYAIIELIELVEGWLFVLKVMFISKRDQTSFILMNIVRQSSLK